MHRPRWAAWSAGAQTWRRHLAESIDCPIDFSAVRATSRPTPSRSSCKNGCVGRRLADGGSAAPRRRRLSGRPGAGLMPLCQCRTAAPRPGSAASAAARPQVRPSAAAARRLPQELPLEQGCSWHGVDSRAGISSWEFQLRIAPVRRREGGPQLACSTASPARPRLNLTCTIRRASCRMPLLCPSASAGPQRLPVAHRVAAVCGAELRHGARPPAGRRHTAAVAPHDGGESWAVPAAVPAAVLVCRPGQWQPPTAGAPHAVPLLPPPLGRAPSLRCGTRWSVR